MRSEFLNAFFVSFSFFLFGIRSCKNHNNCTSNSSSSNKIEKRKFQRNGNQVTRDRFDGSTVLPKISKKTTWFIKVHNIRKTGSGFRKIGNTKNHIVSFNQQVVCLYK
ncbi:hypothetical protein F4703DRAFT_1851726 [Phycomyces blakesleeanus]